VDPRNIPKERESLNTTFTLRRFEPAWWLPGPHAQTILGRVLRMRRNRRKVTYVRERFRTPDGDFLDVDFSRPAANRSRTPPIVVLLHGLEGCSDSGYMMEAARLCTEAGLQAAALNFRGRSGAPNRNSRAYHAGETGDLGFLVDSLAERAPGVPLAAIGFSLGGNVLLKYLGERGRDGKPGRLEAAVAVSAPFDLAASTGRMERGMGKVYTRYFLQSLRDGVRAKAAIGPLGYAMTAALDARTLREFDEAVTAPLHGFRDAADYYERSSSIRYLDSIRVPTLVIQARDDPFHPFASDHESTLAANPWLHDGWVERGGHMGFVEGAGPWATRFWAEAETVRFIASILDRNRADARQDDMAIRR
jgi:predicted alpha/beta-fold hydrolase